MIKENKETLLQLKREFKSLDKTKLSKEVYNNFLVASKILERFIKKLKIDILNPDILFFHKGYVGLNWSLYNNKSVFLYIIPDTNKLFIQILTLYNNTKLEKNITFSNFYNIVKQIVNIKQKE